MIFSLLLSVIGIILTIFIVVGVHEGAHFVVARMLGIKVLKCSIGFGNALFRWYDKSGTEYVIAPIPLGGYVKLLDENEGEVAEADKRYAFNRQPLYKRFAVVAAGPISNLLSAILLYWIIFVVGFETPIPYIGKVEPHSIASDAGLKSQQEIIKLDDHPTKSWTAIALRLVMHTGDQDQVKMQVRVAPPATGEKTFLLDLEHWQMNDLKPDPLSSLGITPFLPEIPLIVGIIKPDSPAAASSLKLGDKILAMNGKQVQQWDELTSFIDKHPGEKIVLTIKRNQEKLKIPVTIGQRRDLLLKRHGYIGIGPDFEYPKNLLQKIQYGPLEAVNYAIKEVGQLSYLNLLLFWKLVSSKLSVYSLGGPITIFESASSAFKYGVLSFLSFLAFLNVALGIINFFPIPGLDGGHLLFQLIEAIIRRPIALRIQMLFYRLGFIFLIILLLQALTNDMLRLWN